jgi:exoribonuclease R
MRHEERERMSENDPTKVIGAKYDTEPTIETILERMNAMEERLSTRLDRIETLLDRVASTTFETRADLRDLKKELREHFPFVK